MEQEFVRKRGWFSPQEFLDMMGTVNLIPGPTSTELAIFIGYRRAGWAGLVLGGACFILPAMLIVTVIAWGYEQYGSLPRAAGMLYGIKPVVIAILVQALWSLGRVAVKTTWLALIGLGAITAGFLGVHPLLILFAAALVTAGRRLLATRASNGVLLSLAPAWKPTSAVLSSAAISPAAAVSVVPFTSWGLFLFFLKLGSVLFGSGYLLLAFLRADLVERWHWLTENQLLDAVAVGQFTPGPILTTATFIGFVLNGLPGALVATLGIFLPAFLMVAVIGPLVPRLRQSPIANAFLDGINVASLALMLAVTIQLGAAALTDWLAVVLAVLSGFILLRYRINSAWLVLGGAVVGFVASAWKLGPG
jgi:chromate transporter